jgi:epoxyqueuosine reductase
VPQELRASVGRHIFGCDICQDVCPWNSRAPVTEEAGFAPREIPLLEDLARLNEEEFREFARGTPLARPKYAGFMRNVALASRGHAPPES